MLTSYTLIIFVPGYLPTIVQQQSFGVDEIMLIFSHASFRYRRCHLQGVITPTVVASTTEVPLLMYFNLAANLHKTDIQVIEHGCFVISNLIKHLKSQFTQYSESQINSYGISRSSRRVPMSLSLNPLSPPILWALIQ